MQLKQKWLELFGGYENENEGCDFRKPDFLVSSKCCYYLKEKLGKGTQQCAIFGINGIRGRQTSQELADEWL